MTKCGHRFDDQMWSPFWWPNTVTRLATKFGCHFWHLIRSLIWRHMFHQIWYIKCMNSWSADELWRRISKLRLPVRSAPKPIWQYAYTRTHRCAPTRAQTCGETHASKLQASANTRLQGIDQLCVSGGHPEISDQIASPYLWPKSMHAPMHRPACPQLLRIAAASPKQNLRVCNPMANATFQHRQPVSSWSVKLLWIDCVIRTYVWPAPGLENKGTLELRHPSTSWPLRAGVNAWRVWNLCVAWLWAPRQRHVVTWATQV